MTLLFCGKIISFNFQKLVLRYWILKASCFQVISEQQAGYHCRGVACVNRWKLFSRGTNNCFTENLFLFHGFQLHVIRAMPGENCKWTCARSMDSELIKGLIKKLMEITNAIKTRGVRVITHDKQRTKVSSRRELDLTKFHLSLWKHERYMPFVDYFNSAILCHNITGKLLQHVFSRTRLSKYCKETEVSH